MSRNYQNERAWEKEKYLRLQAKIDKSLGEAFKAKLAEKNIPYAIWLKNKIIEFIEKDR